MLFFCLDKEKKNRLSLEKDKLLVLIHNYLLDNRCFKMYNIIN